MPWGTFQDCGCQCSWFCDEPLPTDTSTGDPPTLAGRFSSISPGVTAPFLWVLVHARLCALEDWSLFASVPWKFYNQIPLAFKVRFSGDSQSLWQVPRLGSLTWCWELSQQWENFFGIIFLQFVGHLPGRNGILFSRDCASPTVSLWLLLCLWT